MRHPNPLRKRLSNHVRQSPMFAAFVVIGFVQIITLVWFHRRYLGGGHTWRTPVFSDLRQHQQRQSGAAMVVPDRWTVVVSVSEGFDDMFANWYHHYTKLDLNNVELILVAEDRTTFRNYQNRTKSHLKTGGGGGIDPSKKLAGEVVLDDVIEGYGYDALGRDVEVVEGDDVINDKVDEVSSGALSHNTAAYNGLVSKRAAHLLRLLGDSSQHAHSHSHPHPLLLYTDVDTVWLSDPRPYLTGDYDLWGPIDSYYGDKGTPYICTGLLAFRATENSRRLLKAWANKLAAEAQLNQPAFNEIWRDDKVIKTKILPKEKFPWGELYFDQGKTEGVVWVHNNYITGKGNKIDRFKKAGLWIVE